jgi:hypothetical protein
MAIELDLSFFKKIRKGVIFLGNSNLNGWVNILIYKTKVCFFGGKFWHHDDKEEPNANCMEAIWSLELGRILKNNVLYYLTSSSCGCWIFSKSHNSPNIGLNLWCKSYWILNTFFIENFMKSKLKMCEKSGHTIGIVKQPLMNDILWRWFHNF